MKHSIKDILLTFPDHEYALKQIFDEQIQQLVIFVVLRDFTSENDHRLL